MGSLPLPLVIAAALVLVALAVAQRRSKRAAARHWRRSHADPRMASDMSAAELAKLTDAVQADGRVVDPDE